MIYMVNMKCFIKNVQIMKVFKVRILGVNIISTVAFNISESCPTFLELDHIFRHFFQTEGVDVSLIGVSFN